MQVHLLPLQVRFVYAGSRSKSQKWKSVSVYPWSLPPIERQSCLVIIMRPPFCRRQHIRIGLCAHVIIVPIMIRPPDYSPEVYCFARSQSRENSASTADDWTSDTSPTSPQFCKGSISAKVGLLLAFAAFYSFETKLRLCWNLICWCALWHLCDKRGR